MADKEPKQPVNPDEAEKEIEESELNDEELDEASGGIIIVSGKQQFSQLNSGLSARFGNLNQGLGNSTSN